MNSEDTMDALRKSSTGWALMLILYWQLGFLMIPTIAGFTASIVAMAWITALVF